MGTLLQAHTRHKGDVNALSASPSHNMVFSAGSDGQVWYLGFCTQILCNKILYNIIDFGILTYCSPFI